MKNIILLCGFFCLLAFSMARAADPALPEAIAVLKTQGIEFTYLGNDLGLNGWVATKNGQQEYYYAAPDEHYFFLGVLHDKKGDIVTVDQLKRLQKKDPVLFNKIMNITAAPSRTGETAAQPATATLPSVPAQNSEKAERLMADMQSAAGFRLGTSKAPVIYTFVDPLCTHCKSFVEMALPAIRAGKLAIQAIPVGVIAAESLPMSAFLLDTPDAADRYIRLVEHEDITAVPYKEAHDTARVQANMDLMTKWKFDGTPTSVYRAKDGKIKIMIGTVDSMDAILKDF